MDKTQKQHKIAHSIAKVLSEHSQTAKQSTACTNRDQMLLSGQMSGTER